MKLIKMIVLTEEPMVKQTSANMKDVVIGVGGGYHWFWKSFNIAMGAYRTNREKVDLKDTQGNNYKDSVGSRLAIELTIGGKF